MIKDNKAITITMLTVVVIVLSILAGVTVSFSVNSGLINIANKSTENFDDASIKQMIDGIYLSERNKYNSGLISETNMWDNIKNNIESNTKVKFSVQNIDNSDITKGIKVNIDGEAIYKITMENGIEVIE